MDSTRIIGAALALGLIWIGWSGYQFVGSRPDSRALDYAAGSRYLEDGAFDEALREYERMLSARPDDIFALRGMAQALLQTRRFEEALALYDRIIGMLPSDGVSYANRGIIKDYRGDYEGAIRDYEQAIRLTPRTAEGHGWLDRFMHNEPHRPPTIASRAAYLREQMDKPENDRLLRLPEVDAQQRVYRM